MHREWPLFQFANFKFPNFRFPQIPSRSPRPRGLADGVQVDDFGDFIARGEGVFDRAQARDGRKVTHAPVHLGQERGGGVVERGQEYQQWRGLPLCWGEARRVRQRERVLREGRVQVKLRGNGAHSGHGFAGEGFELRDVRGGEGVGVIENEHYRASGVASLSGVSRKARTASNTRCTIPIACAASWSL